MNTETMNYGSYLRDQERDLVQIDKDREQLEEDILRMQIELLQLADRKVTCLQLHAMTKKAMKLPLTEEEKKYLPEGVAPTVSIPATVIEIFVPPTDGPQVFGQDGKPIDLPRFIVTGHELLRHGSCGTGQCAVDIENTIRQDLGLPLRSGQDHESLPGERPGNSIIPTSTTITANPDLIPVQPITMPTNTPIMRPLKKPREEQ